MNNNINCEKETSAEVNYEKDTKDKALKKLSAKGVRILGYAFAVFCALAGLVSGYSAGLSLLFVLIGVLALPLTKDLLIRALKDKEALKKKILTVRTVAVVILFLGALSCVPSTEKAELSNGEMINSQYNQDDEVTLTDEDIEKLVSEELYDEISKKKQSGAYRSSINPSATKYRISTVESKDGKYVVYGIGTLYDKYGNICRPYNDDSGDFDFDFEVTISKSSGKVSYSKIKF